MRREFLENKIADNAKTIEIDKSRQEYLMRKVFDNNEELRELEQKLKLAQVNKSRKAQLEDKQKLENENMLNDFNSDKELLEKLQKENNEELIKLHNKKHKLLNNEKDVRNQIINKEQELENELLKQKYKDKNEIDVIVNKILSEDAKTKDRIENSKKVQFNNMTESLWLKKQLLKTQKEQDQRAYQEAVDFQKILDQRSLDRAHKEAAATEFKEKVYAQIESYIKQKKALEEAREEHFKELGDAKY